MANNKGFNNFMDEKEQEMYVQGVPIHSLPPQNQTVYNYPQQPQSQQMQMQPQQNPQYSQNIQPYMGSYYQPQQQHSGNQNVVFQVPQFPTSSQPQILYCEICKIPSSSIVDRKVGKGTWLVGTALACCGLIYGCCLIPCVVDDCKDSVHMCEKCGSVMGRKGFIFN